MRRRRLIYGDQSEESVVMKTGSYKLNRIASIAAVAAALVATSSAAQAATQIGMLECRTGPRIGLILGSFNKMTCTFRPNVGPVQRYTATEGRIGVDLGITAGGVLAWAVFAPSNTIAPGALAGTYGGASGDVAIGVGAGANVLFGGSSRSIALQPLSLEGQIGVSLAAGVTGLTLRYQP
jgi:hypothetical protein